ncbi:calcium-binding protein [Amaricoccus sp. W119]|uniref:calcium-binding protein n=1 Tax=Amaricoccus sp. W119 TaxID=3391833 RepID=UPI0039A67CBF
MIGFWTSAGADGFADVEGRVGGDNTVDFIIPDITEGHQRLPAATAFGDGGFAVAFESNGPSARDGTQDALYDTYVRFADPNGSPRGPALQLTPNHTGHHLVEGITTLTSDESVTLVGRIASDTYTLLAYRHDSDGEAIGGVMRLAEVSGTTARDAGAPNPVIASGRGGNFAVGWRETDSDGYVVKVRVFEADGTPVSDERTVVPVIRAGEGEISREIMNPEMVGTAGGYALTWHRESAEAADGQDVYFRLLDTNGVGETRSVRVNGDRQSGDQFVHDVVDLGEGHTLVTYIHTVEDAFGPRVDGYDLYGRVMGPDGRPVDASVRITEQTQSDLGFGNTTLDILGDIGSTYQATIGDQFDVFLASRSLDLPWRAGDGGADRLRGTLVDDRLSGRSGDDRLYGNTGDDTLTGGRGDDRLVGQLGNDRLRGGVGEDTFVFNSGRDVIEDFADGRDRIELTGLSRAEARPFIIAREARGEDTLISFPEGHSIRIKDTDPDEIGLGDFLF